MNHTVAAMTVTACEKVEVHFSTLIFQHSFKFVFHKKVAKHQIKTEWDWWVDQSSQDSYLTHPHSEFGQLYRHVK